MTVLAAPLIIAAHVEHLPNLPGWGGVGVFDGAAVTRGDTREWVTVGYVPDTDSSLSFEAVPTAQHTTIETGTVDCQLVVAADDIAAARARALGLIAAWSQWLVTDRPLRGSSGAPRLLPGSEAHLSAAVTFAATRSGTTANATVTITYTAVTYG